MNIKIRKAVPKDARELIDLYYKTWLATYPNKRYKITVDDIKYKFKGRFEKDKIAIRKKRIAHPDKGSHTFVAVYNKRIVGVCGINIDKIRNKLRAIYILPKFQGRGIGKLLWNKVEPLFNKKNKTIVQVATYNKGAINFYKKMGFVDTKKRFTDKKHKMKSGAIIPEMEMKLKK